MHNRHADSTTNIGRDQNDQYDKSLTNTKDCPQRVIGLTGGIGMGKSTVSRYLEQHYQVPVLDADLLARDAVAPGSQILEAIAQRYGLGILRPDGHLDRTRLADIVFQLSSERLWLDQQIHPYVRHQIETALHQPEYLAQSMVVLAIPLLFEARMIDLATEIWVVWCQPDQQIERMIQRSIKVSELSDSNAQPLTRDQAIARIQAQMDIQKKLQRADVVLDNSCSLDSLYREIDQALTTQLVIEN